MITTFSIFFNNGQIIDIDCSDYDWNGDTLDFYVSKIDDDHEVRKYFEDADKYDGDGERMIATFKLDAIYGVAVKSKAEIYSQRLQPSKYDNSSIE